MRPFCIVGAGGIGCAVGYFLRAAGVPVRFVDADPLKIAWGNAHGVQVDQRPPLPASFVHFEEWQPDPRDTILLCTKCYDNAAVLAKLSSDQVLIPIQNGFDPHLDARRHSVEGIAAFVSECVPQRTQTRITRKGRLHFGCRFATTVLRPTDLCRVLSGAPFTAAWVPDILPYKYAKLMYNAAISPLAAMAGLDNGQLLKHPRARQLFFALLRENYAILKGAGIPLGKIGPFHPDTVARILRRLWVADALAWAFYPSLKGSYCSMASDLPKGRTEIDNYTGHLIELAGARPCPLNRRVYELFKRMEANRLPPEVHRLDELRQPSSDPMAPGVRGEDVAELFGQPT